VERCFRLGKIVEDGQFEVIASSEEPIRPEPYAASRSPAAWNAFLADLQQGWDGLWANPGRSSPPVIMTACTEFFSIPCAVRRQTAFRKVESNSGRTVRQCSPDEGRLR